MEVWEGLPLGLQLNPPPAISVSVRLQHTPTPRNVGRGRHCCQGDLRRGEVGQSSQLDMVLHHSGTRALDCSLHIRAGARGPVTANIFPLTESRTQGILRDIVLVEGSNAEVVQLITA